MSSVIFNPQIQIIIYNGKLIDLVYNWVFKAKDFNIDCQNLKLLYTTYYENNLYNTKLLRSQLYKLLEIRDKNRDSIHPIDYYMSNINAATSISTNYTITKQNIDKFINVMYNCIIVFLDGFDYAPKDVIVEFNLKKYFVNLNKLIKWLSNDDDNKSIVDIKSEQDFPSIIEKKEEQKELIVSEVNKPDIINEQEKLDDTTDIINNQEKLKETTDKINKTIKALEQIKEDILKVKQQLAELYIKLDTCLLELQ